MGIFSDRHNTDISKIVNKDARPRRVVLINDERDVEECIDLLNQFEDDIYIKNFPIKEEREEFETILDRIRYGIKPITAIVLATEGDTVIGGCVSVYYPQCKSLFPIYLAIRPEYRKMGFGRLLFDCSLEQFPNAEHMFIEVDNPSRVDIEHSVMSPTDRILVYKRMGFELVPLNYVQAPAAKGQQPCFTLSLMHRGEPVTKDVLKNYLHCVYEGLNSLDSPYLQKMYDEIDRSKLIA